MPPWSVRALPWLLALGACSDTAASGPPPLDGAVSAGIARIRRNEHEEGLAALQAALAHLDPWDVRSRVEALRWCAQVHVDRGRPEEALAQLDLALQLEPADPWLHYARGGALRTMGEHERALGSYERALELDPRHVKSAQWLGDTLELVGRDADAEAAFGAAIAALDDADPDELAAWGGDRGSMLRWTLLARARVRDSLGDGDGARSDRERARALGAER